MRNLLPLYFLVCVLLVGYVMGYIFFDWVRDQADQIRDTQRIRTDFALKCVRQNGYTIRLRAENTSLICVGPDGRIIGKY